MEEVLRRVLHAAYQTSLEMTIEDGINEEQEEKLKAAARKEFTEQGGADIFLDPNYRFMSAVCGMSVLSRQLLLIQCQGLACTQLDFFRPARF